MADIPIQRKEGRNIWPMIIGLLVIAAALWFLFMRPRTDTAAARADSAAVATPAVTPDSAAGAATTPPPATAPRTDSAARP